MTTLTNNSEEATELQNAAGVRTPILEVQPRDGTQLVFSETGDTRGQVAGIPIFAELKGSNGNDLPRDTSIALAVEVPGSDERVLVSELKDNIGAYRRLSLNEQTDTEKIDSTKFDVRGGNGLQISDDDRLFVVIESSAQIDYANSRVEFSRNAVTEVQE